jgi:hypothetical protein
MADNDQTAERRYLETAGPVLVGPGHGPTHLEELAGIVAELARRLEVLEDYSCGCTPPTRPASA